MPDLPSVNGMQTIKAFEKFGFVMHRVKGSHHIMKKPDHAYVLTLPVHGARSLKPETLRSLIRGAMCSSAGPQLPRLAWRRHMGG